MAYVPGGEEEESDTGSSDTVDGKIYPRKKSKADVSAKANDRRSTRAGVSIWCIRIRTDRSKNRFLQ